MLARHESDLVPAVDALLGNGVLVLVPGQPECYALSRDPDMRSVIDRFISLAGQREHRLEFVRKVLGHMTTA